MDNVSDKLQKVIREHFADSGGWNELAKGMGISIRAVNYALSKNSTRPLSYRFVGNLIVHFPQQWRDISEKYYGGKL
jgi:hypothetical protein